MATVAEQLQAMRQLGENWDGYGAAAPQPSVIDLAQELAALLQELLNRSSAGSAVLHVSPTCVGGVLIDWEDQSMQHEIELNPDRSLSFLHADKSTGRIDTRKFSPAGQAVVVPGLLQELRQLLAA